MNHLFVLWTRKHSYKCNALSSGFSSLLGVAVILPTGPTHTIVYLSYPLSFVLLTRKQAYRWMHWAVIDQGSFPYKVLMSPRPLTGPIHTTVYQLTLATSRISWGGVTLNFAVDHQVVEGIGSGLNIRGVLGLVLQLTTRWLKV